ncbi:MAG: hypothetical protein JWO33_1381 [Caulobacteraceae bacterium]|nr:hypothetical protein [Caulobacteraceae bacterium]
MAGARRPKRAWLAAVAVTLGVHAIVVVLLVPDTGPIGGEPPVVDIELPPPLRVAKPILKHRDRRPPPRPDAVAHGSSRPPPPAAEARETEAAAVPDHPGPLVEPAEGEDLVGAVRQALKESAGCEPRRSLGPTDRRDCERRQMALARLRPPGPVVEDDLSKGGRFAPRDPTPWLAQAPKKGCKPKTGGGSGMGGNDFPVFGIACVFRF